jgi:membrane protein required for beta-lactamase induction
MKLNDPFGRLAHRDESSYAAVRLRLKAAGIDDVAEVERILKQTRRNVLAFCAAVVFSTLGLALLLPRFALIIYALALLLLAVAVHALIQGRRHLRRYMTEETNV